MEHLIGKWKKVIPLLSVATKAISVSFYLLITLEREGSRALDRVRIFIGSPKKEIARKHFLQSSNDNFPPLPLTSIHPSSSLQPHFSLSPFTLLPHIMMVVMMMIHHLHLRRLLLLLLSLHLPSPNTQEEDIITQIQDQESQEKEDEQVVDSHQLQDFKIRVCLISLYFFL